MKNTRFPDLFQFGHAPVALSRPALFPLFGLLLCLLLSPKVSAFDYLDGKGGDEIVPTMIKASSTLQEEGYSHDAWQLIDNDWLTDWAEGAKGIGVGESITFTFPSKDSINTFSILPGFWKSQKLFNENGAPTKIRISSGSFSQTFDLSDCLDYGGAGLSGVRFSLKNPLSCKDPLKVTILAVREGTLYEDCCITELHFYGQKAWDGKEEKKGDNEIQPSKAYASSTLQEEGYDNSVWQMFDYDWETGWQEGAKGQGTGEYCAFRFPKGTTLTGLSILPGSWKTRRLFFRNAAPCLIWIKWGDYTQEIDLSDYVYDYINRPLEGIHFSFDKPLSNDGTFFLKILSVRDGFYYEDCAITELHFFGTKKGTTTGGESAPSGKGKGKAVA